MLEIVAGIVVGPSVLGIVEVDEAVQVVALLGLAFVLFLAGLEIGRELDQVCPQPGRRGGGRATARPPHTASATTGR